jgi:citrate synthase
MSEFKQGLEDVVAVQTILSNVDGEAGRLVVRGRDIEDWVANETFDSFMKKFWRGLSEEAQPRPGAAREAIFAHVQSHLKMSGNLQPIEKLRSVLASLPDDHHIASQSLVVATMSVAVPAIIRLENGGEPLAPDGSLPTATDFLRMVRGNLPDPAEQSALDAYLITVADHGMNASTFAARVVASTKAGIVSSVVAGLCALKGPLHGGAPGPVLDLLDELEGSNDVGAYILNELQLGRRMMGFGHRIYRVRDPRAEILKNAVSDLPKTHGRLAFAENLERDILDQLKAWKPDRPLETNVEYYTALLLEALGFPRSTFTCVFGLGRTLGWTAHAMEQEKTGRLIRPRSAYVGDLAA